MKKNKYRIRKIPKLVLQLPAERRFVSVQREKLEVKI